MRTCKNSKLVRSGFTLIELLIVIIIIGILATITIISYNGIQDRAHYSREQQELSEINQAVQMYYINNDSYPLCDTSIAGSVNTYGWCGFGKATNFILELVPKYASKIPNTDWGNDNSDAYIYYSNGADYKLIRYSGSEGLPVVERTNNALADPSRPLNKTNGAWGYWSDGGKNW